MDVIVNGVTKEYGGGVRAIEHADLRFTAGKTTVIVGPSGSGKTTLLNLIAGLLRPSSGSIFFGDRDVTSIPPESRNIGYVFQSYALFPHLTAEQNVAFGLIDSSVPQAERADAVRTMLGMFGIEALRRRRPAQLSGGEKQRVAIARALARRPAVLLLDEPLSALDAQLREHLRDELKSLFASLDTTTIYVTHDRAEAMLLGDSVVVMNRGRVLQHDTPEQIYRRPASAFVARFFGDANLIEGTIDDSGHHIDTPIGRFATASRVDARRAIALLRPEMFVLAPAQRDLIVRVVSVRYLGFRSRVECIDSHGIRLSIEVPADVSVAPGESLPLRVTPSAVQVLPAEDDAAAELPQLIAPIEVPLTG